MQLRTAASPPPLGCLTVDLFLASLEVKAVLEASLAASAAASAHLSAAPTSGGGSAGDDGFEYEDEAATEARLRRLRTPIRSTR